MEKENKLVGQATQEQIEAWKKQYGEVFAIEVDGSVMYVRKPSRRELSFASAAAAKKSGLEYMESIMKNCKLGGDESIITEDAKFMGASAQMTTLIEVKEAQIKKL